MIKKNPFGPSVSIDRGLLATIIAAAAAERHPERIHFRYGSALVGLGALLLSSFARASGDAPTDVPLNFED